MSVAAGVIKMETPMMEQYFSIKSKYKDCLLFFRLGDFYELFYDDAVIASGVLDLTLTGRDAGAGKRAPMCGVPFHAADSYTAKLVAKGYKVAICEQVENAKASKGLVRRDVVRVVTGGTITDDAVIDRTKNNYILCIYCDGLGAAIACADVSTGEFFAYQVSQKTGEGFLEEEISLFSPSEIICNAHFKRTSQTQEMCGIKPQIYSEWAFGYDAAYERLCRHFDCADLHAFGFPPGKDRHAVRAAGALLEYIAEMQKSALSQIYTLTKLERAKNVIIDANSRKNLELERSVSGTVKGSLLWVLDRTKTAAGARLIRKWVL
ncbi:MAG: DNA mismatch repair protein MutS, partial [Clostridiales bacterium]|nr:DNA mismatch repair protein MutS [Clostridiales bacterium]